MGCHSAWGRKEKDTSEQLNKQNKQLIHAVVQQKLTQHCKAVILQLKKKYRAPVSMCYRCKGCASSQGGVEGGVRWVSFHMVNLES